MACTSSRRRARSRRTRPVGQLGDVVGAIAKDPVKFGKGLISGAGQGFQQFFEHFPQHLKEILLNWVFDQLGATGVPIPSDFSGPSIMSTVLAIVGIDTPMVTAMLGGVISDPDEAAEAHKELAGVLSGDPKALVALLREEFDPASLLPMIKDAAISFLIQTLITQAAERIAALLVPGGAILQAVEAIFKVLQWVINNAARIFTLIQALVGAAAQAVAGNIAGVAAAVENSLVQILVVVIDFLTGYLGLGALGGKLKGVIMKVGDKLKTLLKKVLGAVAKRAKARAKTKHHHQHEHDKHDDRDPRNHKHDDDNRDPQKVKDDAKDPRNHQHDPDEKDPRNHRPDDHDPKKRKDHDDEHDPEKHKDHDDDSSKDDSDEKSKQRAELEKRLKLANQEIHGRFSGHAYPEKEGREIVAQIASKHRVQHHLQFEGHRWHLTLRVNPELNSFVQGKDYKKLREELEASNVNVHSARAMATREYNKALEDKKDKTKAKEIAIQNLRRAIADDAAIEADEDLKKREKPHEVGDDFEGLARAHIQAEAEQAGRIYLPGPRAQENPRAGFDCVEIDVPNNRVIVHEIKRGDLRPLNQQSRKTGTKKETIPLDAGGRTGSAEGVRHLLRNPGAADALAAEHVLSKVRLEASETEGELKQVEVHFASELSASVNNLEDNLDKLIAQLEDLVPMAPKELAQSYQGAIELVKGIRSGEDGKLHRVISVGGDVGKREEEAAVLLLEASRDRLAKADGTTITHMIRRLDEYGKEIGN